MPYQFLQFAIAPEDRAVLHQRIEQRFHKMIELGFQEEVEKLYHLAARLENTIKLAR